MRRLVGPHSIDQLVDRYRAVDVNQKCGQDAPLTGMAYFQALPVRLVGPHSIDQLVDRYRAVDVNQKCGQDAPLTGMAYFQALPVNSSLDLAEQAEIDRHPSGTLSANRSERSMSGSR
ncbi:hypothetical protein [Mycobacterium intermedium]|uniref:hypothetical protein n=1 Tax=Mycobacterium intermedium TaxID=28445 RepID=UPI0021F30202|nr:hypothetical protein [Mycobacterium intermedium]